MAVESVLNDKTLKIVLDTGVVDGKSTHKRISFPVQFAATDENIQITGQALASLVKWDVLQMLKNEDSILREA